MDFDVETQKTLKFLIMRSQKPLAVSSDANDLHRYMYTGTDDHMLNMFSDTCWQRLPHEPEDAAVAAKRYLLVLHAATASLRLSTVSLPLSVMASVCHTLSDIILNLC